MSDVTKYILRQVAENNLPLDEAKKYLVELGKSNRPGSQDIAIIGMAGRFPQAENANEFWRSLRNGVNCIVDFPDERKKDFEHILRNASYTELLTDSVLPQEHVDDANSPAGYMKEIDKFDTEFFGIPPAEATYMDPSQRIAMEVSWEAMEDAGYGGDTLFGTRTGVYLGKEGTNYSPYRYMTSKNPMKLTGSWESIIASRISYLFNFSGPCMLIDTACSAGLVSVHAAIQAIKSGECDQALAGGMNLSITGEFNSRIKGSMSLDAVESSDSIIRTFDERANGTVWGEGVAMVLLKPLGKAISDGDPVHAIIKGSAINNDGASSGLTAPNAESQEQVVLNAWENANISPESLSYVEAHGTGTVLGDPIEFKGLSAAFKRTTKKKQFCAIGSLKTNMGHLVAASGVASLFKVVKSLEHEEMAPTINFGQPNPYINFVNSPLYVCDQLTPWPRTDVARIAGLSSFGFSHTNCHMVVEEAPLREELPTTFPQYCYTLSAKNIDSLHSYVLSSSKYLEKENPAFADLCFTSNVGRGHYGYRLVILANNLVELKDRLYSAEAAVNLRSSNVSSGIYFGHHVVVSDKKSQRDAGEITEKEKNVGSRIAKDALDSYRENKEVEKLTQLASEYCAGADVNWRSLYDNEKRQKIHMPTYPFEPKRFWAEGKISKVKSSGQSLHPLVERKINNDDGLFIFESNFSSETQWVLLDHKIKNTCVVPGTTYLEMARFATQESLGWKSLELKDVFFLEPMVVEDSQSRLVRVVLKGELDTYTFTIESMEEGESQFVQHVEGKVAQIDANEETMAIAALIEQADETIEHYEAVADTGVFQFGPHWDAVRSAWRIGTDALAKVSLQSSLHNEVLTYKLHPSMLDNAMNLLSQGGDGTFLPFTYKSFKLYAPFTDTIYSHVKLKKSSHETLIYDVTLSDESGNVLALVTDYVVKRVNSFAFATTSENEMLAPTWKEISIDSERADSPLQMPSKLLVVTQSINSDRINKFVADNTANNIESVLVKAGDGDFERYEQLLNSADGSGIDGLIYWVANVPGAEQDEANCVVDLLALVKASLSTKSKLPWGIGVVTENAFKLAMDENMSINPSARSAAAFSASIGMEYDQYSVRLLDIDASDNSNLFVHLAALPIAKQFAVRNNVAFVREVGSIELDNEEIPEQTNLTVDGGTYIIIGGLGGLGLALAQYMTSNAKINIVLSGRSALEEQTQWEALSESKDKHIAAKYRKLVELYAAAESIEYVQVDVSSSEQVNYLIDDCVQKYGAISGILNLAGIAGRGFIMLKPEHQMKEVLSPKVNGLVNLHQATKDVDLDYFVNFSSISALISGEGQSDYAAANAFMDAYTDKVNGEGGRMISINWPSWKEIGMAAYFEVDESANLFTPLSPENAFEKLESILKSGISQVIPTTVNPSITTYIDTLPFQSLTKYLGALPFQLDESLVRRLVRSNVVEDRDEAQKFDIDANINIKGKYEDELSETEIALAKIYAAILGLSEIDVFMNFHDMGGDSIIATHLLKLIEQHYPGVVDISDVFSYPSVEEMASFISEQLGGENAHHSNMANGSGEPSDEKNWMDVLDKALESDENVESFLNEL